MKVCCAVHLAESWQLWEKGTGLCVCEGVNRLVDRGSCFWGSERVCALLAVVGRKPPLDPLSWVVDSVNCTFQG